MCVCVNVNLKLPVLPLEVCDVRQLPQETEDNQSLTVSFLIKLSFRFGDLITLLHCSIPVQGLRCVSTATRDSGPPDPDTSRKHERVQTHGRNWQV